MSATIPASCDMGLLQTPQATYQSPGRTAERCSGGKRHSTSSTMSRGSGVPTFVYDHTTSPPGSPEEDRRRRSSSYMSKAGSEESLNHKMNVMLSQRPGTFSLIAYLAITVPSIALLAFLYTLITTLPLAIAHVCHATGVTNAIIAGHHSLFAVHAETMELEPPDDTRKTLLLSLTTFPISLLVSISGLFALCSRLYSSLLSEKDSDSSSLDRSMSFWFSWLSLYCKELMPAKGDDLV